MRDRSLSGDPNEEVVNSRQLAFYVGFVALLLAPLMGISTFFGVCFYDSISHFYYARIMGDILVGALFFICGFLLTYKTETTFEWIIAKAAGLAAVGVAIFPTEDNGCEIAEQETAPGRAFSVLTNNLDTNGDREVVLSETPFSLFVDVETIHLISAVILLVVLVIFCLKIFTRISPSDLDENDNVKPLKLRRNRFYRLLGVVMLAALGMILLDKWKEFTWWEANNMMFWMELVVLVAFGISWMIKGRFDLIKETNTGRMLNGFFVD